MILISHRGNIEGANPDFENNPEYIYNALRLGYNVEIDVWYKDGKLKLGHDEPQYDFPFELFKNWSDKLWLHCKNIEALQKLNREDRIGVHMNYFWHDIDYAVLTSKGYIWSINPVENGILVMPEHTNSILLEKTIGICSDNIKRYG